MDGTDAITGLVVTTLVLGSVAGVGLVAAEDFESATDGELSNGEEIRAAEDDDDQVKQINYTFVLSDHTPGAEVSAKHFAVGLTENATLHRIKLYSEDIGYSNCEPDNTAAFGIDRNDNDPGTNTDVSLLTSFKSYTSEEDFIDIKYYREETLAGEPVSGSVHDQVVASQNGCYDNPSEPGWYRINGTITGNVAGGTETDYVIRDLSNYFYICDCDSRAEAEETLGPPPSESGDGGDGAGSDGDTSDGESTPTATATTTATATAGSSAAEQTGTATRTPTATATPTAAPTDGATPTATATATAADGTPEPTATVTATPSGEGAGSRTATATRTAVRDGEPRPGNDATTPTVGAGPGFGGVAAFVGTLLTALLWIRRSAS